MLKVDFQPMAVRASGAVGGVDESVSRPLAFTLPIVVEKDRIISELRTRLANVSDPLEGWLKQARKMCTAITGTLPAENLMIDLYLLPSGLV